jgi:hypothetical protein
MPEMRAGRCVGGPYDGRDFAWDRSFFELAEITAMTLRNASLDPPKVSRYDWSESRSAWLHESVAATADG